MSTAARRLTSRSCMGLLPLHLREQPEHDRPRRLVLLQVDQQLAELPRLWVAPELADQLDPVEVGQARDVEEFGACRRREGLEAIAEGGLHFVEGHGAEAGTSRRLKAVPRPHAGRKRPRNDAK